MNKDLITLNEVLNSGSSIDLYQEENTGLWATYGYSASSYSIRTGFSVWRIFQYICRCLVYV